MNLQHKHQNQYRSVRFATQLAAITAKEIDNDENFIIEPIGVLNYLCNLLDVVDSSTRKKMVELIDLNAATPVDMDKKLSSLKSFFSLKGEGNAKCSSC